MYAPSIYAIPKSVHNFFQPNSGDPFFLEGRLLFKKAKKHLSGAICFHYFACIGMFSLLIYFYLTE